MVSYNILFKSIVVIRSNTDFMICMLPETIFYKLVIVCVVKAICFMALASVLAIYYMVKKAPIGFER